MNDASPSAPDATELLRRWRAGDAAALDALIPKVYSELRALARVAVAREGTPDAFQATELVHDAFLRLVRQPQVDWQDRAHFFAIAAREMRRILVDRARLRLAQKRGSGARPASLDATDAPEPVASAPPVPDLLALNEALEALEALDAQQARVVELRYFTGLTIEETAAALGVSIATVKREWSLARAWLGRRLEGLRL